MFPLSSLLRSRAAGRLLNGGDGEAAHQVSLRDPPTPAIEMNEATKEIQALTGEMPRKQNPEDRPTTNDLQSRNSDADEADGAD